LARVCQQSDDLTALPTEVCPINGGTTPFSRCPRRGTPTRCCQEPQEPLIALIQSLPACGCKAIFRVAIPSQSKRALWHRRTGEHFYEHEPQRKIVRVFGERTRTPPSRGVRSSPPCSLNSRPKLIIRGAYGSCRQQSSTPRLNATWRARDFLEVETPKLYRAGCAPAVGSGP
jgi:hypothetical protein